MPGKGARFPLEKGFFNTASVADPGTNADISWTPPANLIVMPLTFSCLLFAANAGVVRPVTVSVNIPTGTVLWRVQHPVSQPINTTLGYSGSVNGGLLNVASISNYEFPLPEVYLTSADNFTFAFGQKQATDRITAFRISFLEFRNTP